MGEIPRIDRDIPIPVIGVSMIVFILPLFLLCWYFVGIWYVGLFSSVFMMIFGFLFACVGAYMAGLVGYECTLLIYLIQFYIKIVI